MGILKFLGRIFGCNKQSCCQGRKTSAPKQAKSRPVEKEIGVITHYYGNLSVGIIKLNAPLRVGDRIHIKGVHDDFSQEVTAMQLNHQDIKEAAKGAEVGVKIIQRVHENDRVFLPLA